MVEQPHLHPWTLRLTPRALEKQFWKSVRVLKLLDTVGLFSSVTINVMLMRKLGLGTDRPDWLWHFGPVIAYFTAGVAQLCFLFAAPARHQRHRFALNLANRAVKLVTVTWAVQNMSQVDVMAQFAGKLNDQAPGAASGLNGASLRVLRTIASVPVIWVTHAANFLLPYWIMAPLQLYTLLISSGIMRPTVCALASQPPHIVAAASAASRRLRAGAHYATLLAMRVTLPSAPEGAEAELKELLLLVAFTFTMVLLVVPCSVAYSVERSWKAAFLRAKQLQRAEPAGHAPAPAPQPLFVWLLGLYRTAVMPCVAWVACEAAVAALPPLACAGAG